MTDRTFTSELVAWCPEDKWYMDALYTGSQCGGYSCPRILVKRRMLICSVEDCQQAYKKLEDAENHDCFSAY